MSNADTPSEPPHLSDLPFGLRMRTLRIARDWTQEDLAERIGTTKATISKIERSTMKPTMEWAERFSEVFKVPKAIVLMGDPYTRELGAASSATSTTLIPVIGMIAAGNWREAIQHTEERIPVAGAKPNMFALRIDGDSIDRVAPDGSYVTIDPTMPSLQEGRLYAVQNGEGEATIKRFRTGPDRLEPDSTNPVHQPILLGSEAITIIGRATSVTRPL